MQIEDIPQQLAEVGVGINEELMQNRQDDGGLRDFVVGQPLNGQVADMSEFRMLMLGGHRRPTEHGPPLRAVAEIIAADRRDDGPSIGDLEHVIDHGPEDSLRLQASRGIERIDHKNAALLPGPMPKDLAEIVGGSQLGAECGSACDRKEVDRQEDDVGTSARGLLRQTIG
jgi:hypothetical protein